MVYTEKFSLTQTETLLDVLQQRATKQGHKNAYTFLLDGEDNTESITYQALADKAQALAAHLLTICKPGDRVLLVYPSSLDYIIAFFACLYAGVIAVPVYPPRPNRSLSRIESIITSSQAQVALTQGPVLTTLSRTIRKNILLDQLQWVATDKLATFPNKTNNLPTVNHNEIAFLQYTSGSTSAPKGVMISHKNILHNLQIIHESFEQRSNQVGMSWLPMYHDMGLIGGVLTAIYSGFEIILMSPLLFLQKPLRWLEAIDKYRVNVTGGPNFAYDFCIQKIKPEQISHLDLSCWELAFTGAEPINYDTFAQFADKFAPCGFNNQAFYACYGMAEATLMVSGGQRNQAMATKTIDSEALLQNSLEEVTPEHPHGRTIVSCGQPYRDQTVVIVNPKTLEICPDGQVGEIWISGDSIAHGYWDNQEITQQTFHAYIPSYPDQVFLRTGDLGAMLDHQIYITGRIKDVIIVNGANYYPQDIEWTVEQYSEEVRPSCCAAFSVKKDGKECLVVIAEVDRSYWQQRQTLDHKPLLRKMKRAIMQHHDLQPVDIALLKPATIAKTSSGKLQRHLCQQQYLEDTLSKIEL